MARVGKAAVSSCSLNLEIIAATLDLAELNRRGLFMFQGDLMGLLSGISVNL